MKIDELLLFIIIVLAFIGGHKIYHKIVINSNGKRNDQLISILKKFYSNLSPKPDSINLTQNGLALNYIPLLNYRITIRIPKDLNTDKIHRIYYNITDQRLATKILNIPPYIKESKEFKSDIRSYITLNEDDTINEIIDLTKYINEHYKELLYEDLKKTYDYFDIVPSINN